MADHERPGLFWRLAWWAAAGAVLAAVLFLIPLPYIILGPGAAIDLSRVLTVQGHAAPPVPLYLTDVSLLPGRPAYYLVARFLPGFEILRRQAVVPRGMSDRQLQAELGDAMRESQLNAQIVAERAAGLKVKTIGEFIVTRVLPRSPATRCLRVADVVRAVNGRPLARPDSLMQATQSRPPGTAFVLDIIRGGHPRRVTCATYRYRGAARFGVIGSFVTRPEQLPVKVTFHLPDVNGSSAGLMFALQIYRVLTGTDITAAGPVAGTGVLAPDGTVHAVEGAREKIRAAVRAGAAVFLVPAENYPEVAKTPGIRIIPVRTFAQALAALAPHATGAGHAGSS
jgi:PDZ domain-containing protein